MTLDEFYQVSEQSRSFFFTRFNVTNIDQDDLIIVPWTVPSLQYWDTYIEHLSQQIINRPNSVLVFHWLSESMIGGFVYFSSYIIGNLVHKVNFDKSKCFIICGNSDTDYTRSQYEKCKNIYKYLPDNILYNNFYEYAAKDVILPREPDHTISKDKKILCLNGLPRLHRLAVISEIIDRNLWDECKLSLVTDLSNYNRCINQYCRHVLPNLYDKLHTNIDNIKHLLPINLSLEDNMHNPNEQDVVLHETTLFSIVTESLFYGDLEILLEHPILQHVMWAFPGTYLTEKTYRAIRLSHPFLLVTTPHAIKGLRELGYKTFHPYIDETYDDIENDEERLLAIMNEVERLCNMNDSETQEWLSKVHEITKFNLEKLLSCQQTITDINV